MTSQHKIVDSSSWYKGSYFYLLLLLLLTLFLLPLMSGRFSSSIPVNLLFSLIMLVGVYSLFHSRSVFWAGILFMLPALLLRWVSYFINNPLADGLTEIFTAVFLFFNFMVIIIHLLQEKAISLNTIYGGIVAYLLIALSFASLYHGIYLFNDKAFLFNGALETLGKSLDELPFGDFTYYSLITLSTVGYGEITPFSNLARFSSAFQGILGQLYLTIFLARLVGLHISQHQNS